MLTIKPANEIVPIDEAKLQSVIDSIMLEVEKAKSSRYRSGNNCSLPANYRALSPAEKDHLTPILRQSGYLVKNMIDQAQGRSWDRLEWT